MSPEWWEAFASGYDAGVADGIELGRAQAHREEWPVWAQFAARVRALGRTVGPLEYRERQAWIRDRQNLAAAGGGAGLSGLELIETARASWATLTPAEWAAGPDHRL